MATYKMNEFCKMVGFTKSKIRFYEKYGLFQEKRMENGYRYFTKEDAFRVNAFLVLQQYGFTVEKAIQMLDEAQAGEEFVGSLMERKAKLEREMELARYRAQRIDWALECIRDYKTERFIIEEESNYLYSNASNGLDFSPSIKNAKTLTKFYDLISVTRCARIITLEELLGDSPEVSPSYIIAIPEQEAHLLGEYDHSQVKRMELGRCLVYTRTKNRSESVKRESFRPILDYAAEHGLKFRGDILLVPTFLNLDEKHSDVETLLIPIEEARA